MSVHDLNSLGEQLRSLRETPLRAGFEDGLHERLVAASHEPRGAKVVPFTRKPRRKFVFVLAAMSVPLAAAAASGVMQALMQQPAPAASPSQSYPEITAKKAAPARSLHRAAAPKPELASDPDRGAQEPSREIPRGVAATRAPSRKGLLSTESSSSGLRGAGPTAASGASSPEQSGVGEQRNPAPADGHPSDGARAAGPGLERLGLRWSGAAPSPHEEREGSKASIAAQSQARGLRRAGTQASSDREAAAARARGREGTGREGAAGNRQEKRALGREQAGRQR